MDSDDSSEINIDTSAPGAVHQQVGKFNALFQKHPERFPSKPLTKAHFHYLKSLLQDPKVSRAAPERSIDFHDKSAEDSVLTDELDDDMAIGVVPSTSSSSYTPVQRARSLQTTQSPSRAESGSSTPPSEPQEASSDIQKVESSGEKPVFHSTEKESLKEAFNGQPSASGSKVSPPQSAVVSEAPASEEKKVQPRVSSWLKKQSPGRVTPVAAPKPSPTPPRSAPNVPSRSVLPEPLSLTKDKRGPSHSPATPESKTPTTGPSLKAKAQPVRLSFENAQIPPKPVPKTHTATEPFRLASLKRHEVAQEKLKAELKAKEKDAEERRKFKAQPILQPQKTQPVKGTPPTQSHEFKFALDARLEKRKEFLKSLEEREALRFKEKKLISEKTMAEMEEQMKEYRKQLGFRASPMPSFYKTSKSESSKSQQPLKRFSSAPTSPTARRQSAAFAADTKSRAAAVAARTAGSHKSMDHLPDVSGAEGRPTRTRSSDSSKLSDPKKVTPKAAAPAAAPKSRPKNEGAKDIRTNPAAPHKGGAAKVGGVTRGPFVAV